jgi:hypothetical protein
MTLIAEPKRHPRMPGQQAEVMPGSPTAVVALFAEIVRERFRAENELPWVWREGETPAPDETGEPDAPRKILIEPAFVEHDETRNYRPAIFVDKGETVTTKVAIGNFAGKHLQSGLKGFYSLGTIPIDIECVSDKKGESATLADTIWFYILAGREQIRDTFGLHEVSEPVLGRTLPAERDKQEWSTHVSFTIQTDLRWVTKPVAPLLNGIVMRFRRSDETNPDVFLLKEYIH